MAHSQEGAIMADRSGIFAGDDPFQIARRWLKDAEQSEPNDPNAAALATVDDTGMPNVRIVLIKAIDDDALVFFTNYDSQKGREIATSGKVALDLHWKSLKRQIRVRGLVARESEAASDAYYASRALGSRIGAWASRQSEPLAKKSDLVKAVAKAQLKHGLTPARPPHWGGFRIAPLEVEFWAAGEFRLHDRFRWRRDDPGAPWQIQRLNP